MRHSIYALLAGTLLMTSAASAQQGPPVVDPPEEMQRLAQLAGDWKGTAELHQGPATMVIRQTEHVRTSVNGHALVIEGRGVAGDEGRVVHDALAVIFWSAEENRYHVHAWKADGTWVDATATMDGDHFVWGFDAGPVSIRFTIDLSQPGRWNEVGEMSRDGGTWSKFIELNLERE